LGMEGDEDFIEYSMEILIGSLMLLFTIVICLGSTYLCRKFKFGINGVWENTS
jgi:hypothetical protein